MEHTGAGSRPRLLAAALREGPLAANFRYRTLRWLYRVARVTAPTVAVETGVKRGASSLALLCGIRDGARDRAAPPGRLHSIDLPHHTPWRDGGGRLDRSRISPRDRPGSLVPQDLREFWTLELGDARELLAPLLDRVGPVDLFYHDSDHSAAHQRFEYELAWSHLRPGGVLVSDDIHWNSPSPFLEFAARVGGRPVVRGEQGCLWKP